MDKFKKNDTVMVMNNDMKGSLIQEGTAIVISKESVNQELYLVRFPDGYKCLRNLEIEGTIKL